jgi:hypothetical protein
MSLLLEGQLVTFWLQLTKEITDASAQSWKMNYGHQIERRKRIYSKV